MRPSCALSDSRKSRWGERVSTRWKQGMLALPSIGVSILPKLACPACWPAYAGLLTSIGLGFLISVVYLLPLTAAFLGCDVVQGKSASRIRAVPPWSRCGERRLDRQVCVGVQSRHVRCCRAAGYLFALEHMAASWQIGRGENLL